MSKDETKVTADPQIKKGDRVKFNGREGEVVYINYDAPGDGRIVVDVIERDGGKNTHYGHIQQFQPVKVEGHQKDTERDASEGEQLRQQGPAIAENPPEDHQDDDPGHPEVPPTEFPRPEVDEPAVEAAAADEEQQDQDEDDDE